MFTVTENPEFTWSLSRENTFNKCKRQYYYSYYASHNGWQDEKNSTEENRLAYRYKKVTSLQQQFGSSAHDLTKFFLKTNADISLFKDELKSRMHDACLKGSNIEAWKVHPKQNTAMMECLYWGGWKSKKSQDQANKVRIKMGTIDNVFKTKTMQEFFNNDIEKIIELDEDLNTKTFSRFELNNITVFAKIDFLYIRKDGKWIIVDWKTNKKDFNEDNCSKELHQLYLYADYVNRKYKIPYSQMECRLENMVTGNNLTVESVSEEKIKKMEEYILKSIENMSEYVLRNDLQTNKSLDKKNYNRNTGKDDRNCENCQFKAICTE